MMTFGEEVKDPFAHGSWYYGSQPYFSSSKFHCRKTGKFSLIIYDLIPQYLIHFLNQLLSSTSSQS
jgi:hypothetical protein